MSDSQQFESERNGGGSMPQKIETEDQLRTVLTNASISPELFEKLYLSPKNDVSGDLRKTFGNPTPMAVMGFSVAVLPIACELSTRLPIKNGFALMELLTYMLFSGLA